MRQITLSAEAVGLRLARGIYTAEGKPLVREGVVLTPGLVDSLARLGYQRVIVEDGLLDDVTVDDAICEETRVRATGAVVRAFEKLSAGEETDDLVEAVDRIIEDLWVHPDLVFTLSAVRSYHDYTFVHSVDVAVASIVMGMASGYERETLRELGTGALLHDVGKVKVPRDILDKPSSLTKDEFEQMKPHTVLGYEIISQRLDFSYMAAHAALEHHERLDGSGYPRGLRGEKILEIGRITAVADVFCAMTSDRVYRRRVLPQEAIGYLMSGTALFDQRFVRRLALRMAAFPNGTFVRLSTGELAVVVRQDGRSSERPVVRLLADARNQPVPHAEVALVDAPEVQVAAVVDELPDRILRRLAPG